MCCIIRFSEFVAGRHPMNASITAVMILTSLLGNYLLFQLWRGRYAYNRKYLFIAWAFAFVPVGSMIWAPMIGFDPARPVWHFVAIVLNVNAWALTLLTSLKYDPGLKRK